MQPDTTNILSNLDKLKIIPVIQELLNRTEGINLQMPVTETETDFVPDLWQGYGDSDKERIFCQIKSRFSKENELSRIFAIYDQFEPKRLILVFLTKVTPQERKDFLSSIAGKIEVISIYDIDDLNDRLQDQTDLQEKLAEIAAGSDETPDESPLKDKEKIKREPEEIKKRIRAQRDRNFWWINAIPGKWHIDQYEVNQIQTYSTHS